MADVQQNIETNNKQRFRSSNLELYRIICMLMIVAHHFVVNSGLTSVDGPMVASPDSAKTFFLSVFGMWGKIGINCFLMITGYFMCKSQITIKKFLKLILWIYFYKIIIFAIFLGTGYESISIKRIVKLIMPIWGFNQNFTSCFIGFWLTIPFWNILVQNMTKRQHQILIVLLLGIYSILGNIPGFKITFNYITWFGVIYVISSYIRMYPSLLFENKKLWMLVSLVAIILAISSVLFMQYFVKKGAFFFVSDSNKFIAVAVAVSTFIWFKNINIPYSKIINTIGASTFGVLLIHANSNAMRQWLWKDMIDCVGHYDLSFMHLVGYSTGVVFAVFFICIAIDIIRIRLFEEPFFKWYDKKPRFSKFLSFLNK